LTDDINLWYHIHKESAVEVNNGYQEMRCFAKWHCMDS